MKALILIMEALLLLQSTVITTVNQKMASIPAYEANYQELGIPLMENYPDDPVSRSPWDIEVYDNKIFVGGGDYDKNTGPVPAFYYDITECCWVNTGTLPDEQIDRIKIINDTLLIPGCDPNASWEYGNLYKYKDDQWTTLRNIPGGIHQFDIIEYQDMIFVGLGVSPGEYPIVVSTDNGITFRQMMMYKDGKLLNTSIPNTPDVTSLRIRVYDFFLYNDILYAYCCTDSNINTYLELYKFENGAFHYFCDLPKNIKTKRTSYRTFNSKIEYDGNLFFTTGILYITNDLRQAERIDFLGDEAVTDLRIIQDKLYALIIEKNIDGTYRNSIWKYSKTSNTFVEVFYYSFPCPALSFTYDHDMFYFGMGHGILEGSCSSCGSILSVKHTVA